MRTRPPCVAVVVASLTALALPRAVVTASPDRDAGKAMFPDLDAEGYKLDDPGDGSGGRVVTQYLSKFRQPSLWVYLRSDPFAAANLVVQRSAGLATVSVAGWDVVALDAGPAALLSASMNVETGARAVVFGRNFVLQLSGWPGKAPDRLEGGPVSLASLDAFLSKIPRDRIEAWAESSSRPWARYFPAVPGTIGTFGGPWQGESAGRGRGRSGPSTVRVGYRVVGDDRSGVLQCVVSDGGATDIVSPLLRHLVGAQRLPAGDPALTDASVRRADRPGWMGVRWEAAAQGAGAALGAEFVRGSVVIRLDLVGRGRGFVPSSVARTALDQLLQRLDFDGLHAALAGVAVDRELERLVDLHRRGRGRELAAALREAQARGVDLSRLPPEVLDAVAAETGVPTIEGTAPTEGFVTVIPEVVVSGRVLRMRADDRLQLGDERVTTQPDGTFRFVHVLPRAGDHVLRFQVVSGSGEARGAPWQVRVTYRPE